MGNVPSNMNMTFSNQMRTIPHRSELFFYLNQVALATNFRLSTSLNMSPTQYHHACGQGFHPSQHTPRAWFNLWPPRAIASSTRMLQQRQSTWPSRHTHPLSIGEWPMTRIRCAMSDWKTYEGLFRAFICSIPLVEDIVADLCTCLLGRKRIE